MLLSELTIGSFLSYTPRGEDEGARKSQLWVRRLKDERSVGNPPIPMSEYVARRLAARLPETSLGDILSSNALLVPVPASNLIRNASLWVPMLLASAFVRNGLGRDVATCLERSRALRKAAVTAASDRPSAQEHFDSMKVKLLAFPPDEIVLIDDVITRGATMLAAASRLAAIFPRAAIRGFAVVRTISDPSEFTQMLDPRVGTVSLRPDGQTQRRP